MTNQRQKPPEQNEAYPPSEGEQQKDNKPDLFVYAVIPNGRGNRIGSRLGVVFNHKTGGGFTLYLDAVPIPNGVLVEIAVTHFVDSEKLAKIMSLGISNIEVDLSSFLNEPLHFQKLANILIEQVEQKRWVFNVKLEELLQKKLKELEAEEKRQKLEQAENARMQKEEREEIQQRELEEKAQREVFYQFYKKPIVVRRPKNLGSFNGEALHVDDCPLKKNSYHIGGGFFNYFANVNLNCRWCDHYRGMRDEKTAIVCLHDYHTKMNNTK